MAKAAARPRKKVKKTVVDGIAHIHASFNNTIITIQTVRVMLCHGLLQVVLVSAVRVKVLRLQRKLQPSVLVKRRWNLV